MRIDDSLWQGSFRYWQNLFIHQNIWSIANPQIDINLLQKLAILTVKCYEQVCKRWEEFQLCPKS